MSMTTNKQTLRLLAESVDREEWQARKESGIGGEHTVIVKGSLVKRSGWSTHRPIADQVVDKKTSKFIAAANPATVLALLDELESAENRISEREAREVKIPELKMLSDYLREVTLREREDIILGVKLEFHRNLKAAGISVKGE